MFWLPSGMAISAIPSGDRHLAQGIAQGQVSGGRPCESQFPSCHTGASRVNFEVPVEWGMDLGSEHERHLAEKAASNRKLLLGSCGCGVQVFKKPTVVYNYPKATQGPASRLQAANACPSGPLTVSFQLRDPRGHQGFLHEAQRGQAEVVNRAGSGSSSGRD